MKRIFLGLIVSIMVIGLASCESNAPKPVAEKFLNSFWHMDYKDAKKYSTAKTKDMLDMLEEMSAQLPEKDKADARKVKVEIKDVKEEGNKATVTYTTSQIKEEQQLNLVKEGDQWLVQYTKNDNLGSEEDLQDVPDDPAPTAPDTTVTTDSVIAQ